MKKLRVHHYLPFTHVEGPGIRACIWVQGCPIKCDGCAVPQTWPKLGGKEFTISELYELLIKGNIIEGVTYAGGEPFAQADFLAELGWMIKKVGFSLVTFTGYEFQEIIKSNRSDWHRLIDVTDLLIDGPFKRELFDLSRPWVGSLNQKYHFLSKKYIHLKDRVGFYNNKIEVTIQPGGKIIVNGMADINDIEVLLERIS